MQTEEQHDHPFVLTDEHFLTAHVSMDGKIIGIDHPTEADWEIVLEAHKALRDHLNERITEQERCPHRPI